MTKNKLIWAGIAVVLAVLVPVIAPSQFIQHIGVLVLIYVGVTVAWNILAFGGILSLGHAAFFGLGAYTATILYVKLDVNPWLGIVCGIVVAALGSLVLAVPLVRLRGPFFTLTTLAYVEVLHLLTVWAVPLTNGSVGLTTPADQGFAYIAFEDRAPYYYIVLAFALLAIAASVWIYHSRLGYHLRAIQSDEEAVRALGVETNRVKLSALVISAGLTGLFGAFSALYFFVVDPDTYFSSALYSIQPALNGIIGGMGTLVGPIVGAIVMTPLGEWLRVALSGAGQGVNFLIYGLALIVIARLLPGGIVSAAKKLWSRFGPARKATATASKGA